MSVSVIPVTHAISTLVIGAVRAVFPRPTEGTGWPPRHCPPQPNDIFGDAAMAREMHRL
ncbi:hypothetical protein MHIB_06140 [Mycolicibacter hiberniae]|uniref:Uncharacterized protein n=1 Tax=Mycolicibacter hiberniae TaxID=29314 RepID=A0A7I7WX83_9MYCO|nr:hypothetical protein MHIB_06140 [Mycolicibacter hiberniae]